MNALLRRRCWIQWLCPTPGVDEQRGRARWINTEPSWVITSRLRGWRPCPAGSRLLWDAVVRGPERTTIKPTDGLPWPPPSCPENLSLLVDFKPEPCKINTLRQWRSPRCFQLLRLIRSLFKMTVTEPRALEWVVYKVVIYLSWKGNYSVGQPNIVQENTFTIQRDALYTIHTHNHSPQRKITIQRAIMVR